MVTPTHFLPIFSKPLGILDTEGKKKIITEPTVASYAIGLRVTSIGLR